MAYFPESDLYCGNVIVSTPWAGTTVPREVYWAGTTVPKKAYTTYVMGKDAITAFNVPNFNASTLSVADRKKMKKITKKQELNNAYKAIAEKDNLIISLRKQLREQNELLDRARKEGNDLIALYNKLAGKFNALRSLVTSND
jgi:hypothetical protein